MIVQPSSQPEIQAEIERRGWSQQGQALPGLTVVHQEVAYSIGPEGTMGLPIEWGGRLMARQTYWPSAELQLTTLALWPLATAGLILEPPVVMIDRSTREGEFDRLSEIGWPHGVDVMLMDSAESETVRAINLIAHIKKVPDPNLLDELYATAYREATEIVNSDDGDWTPDLVRGKSHLVYRLRYSPGEDTDLLTSQWMGESGGRLGARGMADLALTIAL